METRIFGWRNVGINYILEGMYRIFQNSLERLDEQYPVVYNVPLCDHMIQVFFASFGYTGESWSNQNLGDLRREERKEKV